jgi:hypothetical protein
MMRDYMKSCAQEPAFQMQKLAWALGLQASLMSR